MTDVYVIEERLMTNVEPPPQLTQRQLPVSTVQLAAATSEAVVGGLSKSPMMLGVVVLNMIGIVAAVYFLNLLISGQQQHLKSLLEVQGHQQTEIVQLHKAEFDALLEMAQKYSIAIPTQPNLPLTQPVQPAQPAPPPARSR